MPTYVYERLDTGEVVEVVLTVAQMTKRQNGEIIVLGPDDGLDEEVAARRRLDLERPGAQTSWPHGGLESDALGVHPDQAEEAMAHADRIGVPTEFDRETGCAIFRSRAHRKRYVDELNKPLTVPIHDLDGGYGDP